VSDYHEMIADRDDVELVHISLDLSDEAGEKWALNEKFPWPTVQQSQISEELSARTPQTVPSYLLVNADGTIIATGKKEALAAIKEE
jgi:hypothetical protein